MRISRRTLRGSVTQNTSVRLRTREKTRAALLIRVGVVAGVALLVVGLAVGLWRDGWPQREINRLLEAGLHLTQKAHFAIKDIIVEGRQRADKDDLLAALGTVSGAPILDFDPAAARARIVKLPWVADAVVERRLPDVILVRLTEHVPIACWQHEGRTVVIDALGEALPEAKPEQFASLPLVVGADAAGQAQDLLDMLKDVPAVAQKMTSAVRVGERRWDIHLPPKIVARLPERGVPHALSLLTDLITDQKILERNIVAIDLRDPSKIILEPVGIAGNSFSDSPPSRPAKEARP